jgi:hypothetical protein
MKLFRIIIAGIFLYVLTNGIKININGKVIRFPGLLKMKDSVKE